MVRFISICRYVSRKKYKILYKGTAELNFRPAFQVSFNKYEYVNLAIYLKKSNCSCTYNNTSYAHLDLLRL